MLRLDLPFLLHYDGWLLKHCWEQMPWRGTEALGFELGYLGLVLVSLLTG